MKEIKINQSITVRDSLLNSYLRDISRYPRLTVEEEVELCRLKDLGDKQAYKRLVECNLRFVVSVAKQFASKNISLLDLIQEGTNGLMKAVDRFDHSRGFKLISYAVSYIRQAMMLYINEKVGLVRLPVNKITDKIRIEKSIKKLSQVLLRRPSAMEIAQDLGDMTVDDVEVCLACGFKIERFDVPLSDDDETTRWDIYQKEDDFFAEMNAKDLKKVVIMVLRRYPEKIRVILEMSYGIGSYDRSYSLEEIAQRFDISSERVRRIINTAKKRFHSEKLLCDMVA